MRSINLVLAIVTALAVSTSAASARNAALLQGKQFRTTYAVDNGNTNANQQDRFKVSY